MGEGGRVQLLFAMVEHEGLLLPWTYAVAIGSAIIGGYVAMWTAWRKGSKAGKRDLAAKDKEIARLNGRIDQIRLEQIKRLDDRGRVDQNAIDALTEALKKAEE